ncbi:hypothetical protein DQ237_10315 [Blastococcus sp. TF02-8]|uniref:hypothetical protein n=1 Tax=Blastococcus sp. TF02-8 TaxID=2250574 RepID=UPI000DEB19A1|nr:hypothetical protein [Blastococcus sp. TF02-8]RBY96246.1 hypothetical protein DQ237_10315 [Blastococcus sp. TF02-8]
MNDDPVARVPVDCPRPGARALTDATWRLRLLLTLVLLAAGFCLLTALAGSARAATAAVAETAQPTTSGALPSWLASSRQDGQGTDAPANSAEPPPAASPPGQSSSDCASFPDTPPLLATGAPCPGPGPDGGLPALPDLPPTVPDAPGSDGRPGADGTPGPLDPPVEVPIPTVDLPAAPVTTVDERATSLSSSAPVAPASVAPAPALDGDAGAATEPARPPAEDPSVPPRWASAQLTTGPLRPAGPVSGAALAPEVQTPQPLEPVPLPPPPPNPAPPVPSGGSGGPAPAGHPQVGSGGHDEGHDLQLAVLSDALSTAVAQAPDSFVLQCGALVLDAAHDPGSRPD